MLRAIFNTLRNRVDADQVPVTRGSTDAELGSLIMSDPPTQAEVQVLPEAFITGVVKRGALPPSADNTSAPQ